MIDTMYSLHFYIPVLEVKKTLKKEKWHSGDTLALAIITLTTPRYNQKNDKHLTNGMKVNGTLSDKFLYTF